MIRKIFFAVLVVAFAAAAAHAADNVAGPSYFEGTWTGAWPSFRIGSAAQEVTVTIGRGGKDGGFIVAYSWGGGSPGTGFSLMPGSVRTKGREDGDRFVFGWKNKQGRDFEVTLKKHEENKVKARLERSGPMGPNERPSSETVLTRK